MIMMFAPGKLLETLQRLRRNRVVIEGPDGSLGLTKASVRLMTGSLNKAGTTLTAVATVAVERNVVFVAPNPELAALLGYMPGYATTITEAAPGRVAFTFQKKLTEAETKAVGSLGWLADLYVVPVGTSW